MKDRMLRTEYIDLIPVLYHSEKCSENQKDIESPTILREICNYCVGAGNKNPPTHGIEVYLKSRRKSPNLIR